MDIYFAFTASSEIGRYRWFPRYCMRCFDTLPEYQNLR
jgi:hypothetical protein